MESKIKPLISQRYKNINKDKNNHGDTLKLGVFNVSSYSDSDTLSYLIRNFFNDPNGENAILVCLEFNFDWLNVSGNYNEEIRKELNLEDNILIEPAGSLRNSLNEKKKDRESKVLFFRFRSEGKSIVDTEVLNNRLDRFTFKFTDSPVPITIFAFYGEKVKLDEFITKEKHKEMGAVMEEIKKFLFGDVPENAENFSAWKNFSEQIEINKNVFLLGDFNYPFVLEESSEYKEFAMDYGKMARNKRVCEPGTGKPGEKCKQKTACKTLENPCSENNELGTYIFRSARFGKDIDERDLYKKLFRVKYHKDTKKQSFGVIQQIDDSKNLGTQFIGQVLLGKSCYDKKNDNKKGECEQQTPKPKNTGNKNNDAINDAFEAMKSDYKEYGKPTINSDFGTYSNFKANMMTGSPVFSNINEAVNNGNIDAGNNGNGNGTGNQGNEAVNNRTVAANIKTEHINNGPRAGTNELGNGPGNNGNQVFKTKEAKGWEQVPAGPSYKTLLKENLKTKGKKIDRKRIRDIYNRNHGKEVPIPPGQSNDVLINHLEIGPNEYIPVTYNTGGARKSRLNRRRRKESKTNNNTRTLRNKRNNRNSKKYRKKKTKGPRRLRSRV
tara:strand:- start:1038 stop:2864 length:1827 start_codon:yes stop_codon:yes gene_type:complete